MVKRIYIDYPTFGFLKSESEYCHLAFKKTV